MESLCLKSMSLVSGGTDQMDVKLKKCDKPDKFKSLNGDENCDKVYKNCWNLKYNTDFYCDA